MQATYLLDGHNSPKGELIPDMAREAHAFLNKRIKSLEDGLASYQLVGGVKAHQGDDG